MSIKNTVAARSSRPRGPHAMALHDFSAYCCVPPNSQLKLADVSLPTPPVQVGGIVFPVRVWWMCRRVGNAFCNNSSSSRIKTSSSSRLLYKSQKDKEEFRKAFSRIWMAGVIPVPPITRATFDAPAKKAEQRSVSSRPPTSTASPSCNAASLGVSLP